MSTVTYAEVIKRCKIIVLATPFMFLDTLPLDQIPVGTIVIDCSNRGQVCKEKEISQAEIIQVFLKAYNPPDLMAISETLTKLFPYFLYISTLYLNQWFGRLKCHMELMSWKLLTPYRHMDWRIIWISLGLCLLLPTAKVPRYCFLNYIEIRV